jgi:hypothetical protein
MAASCRPTRLVSSIASADFRATGPCTFDSTVRINFPQLARRRHRGRLQYSYMELVRLMVCVSKKHKQALGKFARKHKVSESEAVRGMMDVHFGKV